MNQEQALNPLKLDEDPKDDSDLLLERRRFWRFQASHKIEYRHRETWCATHTVDLGRGGIRLRKAPELYPGEELNFRLHLEQGILQFQAKVVRTAEHGQVLISFLEEEQIRGPLDSYFEQALIPRWQLDTQALRPSTTKVAQLAALYSERDRFAEAVALLSKTLRPPTRDFRVHERLALFLNAHLNQNDEHYAQDLRAFDRFLRECFLNCPSEALQALRNKVGQDLAQVVHAEEEANRRQREHRINTEIERRVEETLRQRCHELETRTSSLEERERELEAWSARERERSGELENLEAALEGQRVVLSTAYQRCEAEQARLEALDAHIQSRARALEERAEQIRHRVCALALALEQVEVGRLETERREEEQEQRERALEERAEQIRHRVCALALALEQVEVGRLETERREEEQEQTAKQLSRRARETMGMLSRCRQRKHAVEQRERQVQRRMEELQEATDWLLHQEQGVARKGEEQDARSTQQEAVSSLLAQRSEQLQQREREVVLRSEQLEEGEALVRDLDRARQEIQRLSAALAQQQKCTETVSKEVETLRAHLKQARYGLRAEKQRAEEAVLARVAMQRHEASLRDALQERVEAYNKARASHERERIQAAKELQAQVEELEVLRLRHQEMMARSADELQKRQEEKQELLLQAEQRAAVEVRFLGMRTLQADLKRKLEQIEQAQQNLLHAEVAMAAREQRCARNREVQQAQIRQICFERLALQAETRTLMAERKKLSALKRTTLPNRERAPQEVAPGPYDGPPKLRVIYGPPPLAPRERSSQASNDFMLLSDEDYELLAVPENN